MRDKNAVQNVEIIKSSRMVDNVIGSSIVADRAIINLYRVRGQAA